MPIVPFPAQAPAGARRGGRPTPVAPPAEPFALMAAAQMHSEGRLVRDQPPAGEEKQNVIDHINESVDPSASDKEIMDALEAKRTHDDLIEQSAKETEQWNKENRERYKKYDQSEPPKYMIPAGRTKDI